MQKLADWNVDRRKLIFIVTIILAAASVYGMSRVNVNYDMSAYLPDDSSVRRGMKLMEEEFGEMSAVTVMFEGLDSKEQLEYKTRLEEMEHVRNVVYIQDDEAYQKDGYSKYMLNVTADTYSGEARSVLAALRREFGETVAISGAVVDNDMMVTTLTEEIPVIALIAVAVIFLILFLLCESWIEPFLYMGCIGVAVLFNMGTNALLPSVSFMTFAIGALLQMGLSMDYSIMLMNRYSQEREQDGDPAHAMKKALAGSFAAISSSSLTTIAGLLVLLVMSFKIGQDMGIVLAKGVFISLLCIFIILPGLVVQSARLMEKSHKKSLTLNMKPLMRAAGKVRFITVPLLVVVTAGAYLVKDDLEITYIKTLENEAQVRTEKVFGVDNQTILLYDSTEDKANVTACIDWLTAREDVNTVQDDSNTAGKMFTYQQLSGELGISQGQAEIMYQLYQERQDSGDYEKTTMYDLVCYMDEQIAGNPDYEQVMDKEQIRQIKDARKELEKGKRELPQARKEIKAGERAYAAAQKKITEGEAELAEGEAELAEGEQQLAEGERQIAEKEQLIRESEAEIAAREKELAEAEQTIRQGETGLSEAGAQLDAAETELKKGGQQLTAAAEQLKTGEKEFKNGEQQLAAAKEQMAASGMTQEMIQGLLEKQEAELAAAKKQLAAGRKQLDKKQAEYQAAKKQLEAGRSEWKQKQAELLAGKKEAEAGRQKLEAGKRELAAGKSQLETAKTGLAAAKKELQAGRSQLETGRAELEQGKKELAEAGSKLEAGRKQYKEGKSLYNKKMDAKELADVMEQDISQVRQMLEIRRMSGRNVEKLQVSLWDFLKFLTDDVLTDQDYAAVIDDSMRSDILDGEKELEQSREILLGERYNRMVISTNLPVEGPQTFAAMKAIREQMEKKFTKGVWLVGDTPMGYEMDEGFTKELNVVTVLTVIVILIVVMVTFRSVLSSVVLVALIQAAVFITTAIVCLCGYQVNYVALILVQCILMGATIDYGILLFDNYKELRQFYGKIEAVGEAMNASIKTILTSSTILIATCLDVSMLMTQEIIAQTCMILAYGAVCSVILVIFILPAILILTDRWLIRSHCVTGD